MIRFAPGLLVVLLLTPLGGCGPKEPGAEGGVIIAHDPGRDSAAAAAHNEEALKRMHHGNLSGAREELRAALVADELYGPARNTMGILYYRQKSYYEAAREFEQAAVLMPMIAAPRNNMGMVYEAVGKLNEAAKAYEDALAIEPNNVEATANLARALVRLNRKDDRLRQLLDDIVMRDTRSEWSTWARQQLSALPRAATAPSDE